MDNDQLREFSQKQLDRVLGFFPRVDAKASVVFGVDVGMLALLATNAPPMRSLDWYMLFTLIPLFLIGMSLWNLYQGSFPRLEGGHQSLIYFREIAMKTEARFVEDFMSLDNDALVKDLLGQVWRNSEILKRKYDYLKSAFTLLALAIPFWVISLAIFAAKNLESHTLLAK
jgi:hypothetical protein